MRQRERIRLVKKQNTRPSYIVNGQEMNKKELFRVLRSYCSPCSGFDDVEEAISIFRMHGIQCEQK